MKVQINFKGNLVEVGEIQFSHSGNFPNLPWNTAISLNEGTDKEENVEVYLIGFAYTEWSEFYFMIEAFNEDNETCRYISNSNEFPKDGILQPINEEQLEKEQGMGVHLYFNKMVNEKLISNGHK